MSPLSSPNIRNAIALIGVLTAILGAAVGYGTLRADVSTNTDAITDLRYEVHEAKTNAGASAAGASLLARINELDRRMDRIEKQNDEILRLLSRPRP